MSDEVNKEKVAKTVVELFKTIDRQMKDGLSPEEGFLAAILFMGKVISETEGHNVLQAALREIEKAVKSREAA